MLLALVPDSLVFFAVCPLELTVSLFHIGNVITFVLFAIWPREFTISFNLIIFPSSDIYSLITSYESSLPTLHIIFPPSFIITAIIPKLLPLAILNTSSPISLIRIAILRIGFLGEAVKFPVDESAGLSGSIGPYLCSLTVLYGYAVDHFELAVVFGVVG